MTEEKDEPLEKPKKPRSEKQIASWEKAKQIRSYNAKLKQEKLKEAKAIIDENARPPYKKKAVIEKELEELKSIVSKVKEEVPPPLPNPPIPDTPQTIKRKVKKIIYEEADSASEDEIIVRKKVPKVKEVVKEPELPKIIEKPKTTICFI